MIHLQRRWYGFCWRRKVPRHLRSRFVKHELVLSLRTSTRTVAVVRARELSGTADKLFDAIMTNPTLTSSQIEELARSWFFKIIESWEHRQAQLPQHGTMKAERVPGVSNSDDPRYAAEAKESKWWMEQAKSALAGNNFDPDQCVPNSLLKEMGVDLPPGAPERVPLVRALLRAQVEYFRCISAWGIGDFSVKPADPLFQAPSAPHVAPAPQPNAEPKDPRASSMPLAELAEAFIKTKIRDGEWKPATIKNNPRKLRLFAETLNNKPVDLVTRDDIRDWRDVLTDLDLVSNTIGLHFRVVASMFNWAKLEGKSTIDSPLRGLAPKGDKDTREAFTPNDLKTLFHSPLYTGHWRSDRRERPGDKLVKDHKYWLPLVALHSGLRVEEAAKLTLGDVRVVEGVWCFCIQGAKTAAGNRVVPIHPRLMTLGLLEHRAKVEGEGGKQLWPELKKGSEGRYSQSFVQWWSGFRKLIDLGREGLVFHSFRHTFISTMQNAGVAEGLAGQVVGHATGKTVTYRQYGGKLLTPAEKLSLFGHFDFGADLTHLIPQG